MSERENKFLDWLVTKEFPKHDLKIKYFPTVGTNALHRGLTSLSTRKRRCFAAHTQFHVHVKVVSFTF